MWSNQRSDLSLERVKSMMTIKFNTDQTCLEFYEIIKCRPDILKAIKSDTKYTNTRNMIQVPLQLREDEDIVNIESEMNDDLMEF